MNRSFYSRIALLNIRNNKNIYLPYLLAGSLIVMLFYSLRSVSSMVAASRFAGGGTMGAILQLSSWVCGLLSLAILFYINSFIMKRRKKEFGLYSILGMEKRHICLVIIWEVLFAGAASILCGILFGALLGQLLFLVLLKIIGLPAALQFQIPLGEVAATAILFGFGFILLLLYDMVSVCRTDPIALLRSDRVGEKEPKTKWAIVLLGLLTLGAGYLLALTVQSPSDAITVFFPAVLLVIIGTYCLFIAGSILFLKLLRKKKRFYYKPKNFISVSGMMYRMKQNAAGLANICILSTCVLVTLSSTVSLFLGEEDILRAQYPRQVMTSCIIETEESGPALVEASRRHAQSYSIPLQNEVEYANLNYPAGYRDGSFSASGVYNGSVYEVDVIPLADYNRIAGTQLQLGQDEALIAVSQMQVGGDRIWLEGTAYKVRGQIDMPDFLRRFSGYPGALVVLPDLSHLESLACRMEESGSGRYNLMYYHNYDLAQEAPDEYYDTLREDLLESVHRLAQTGTAETAREDFYQLYGSLLFVGIFFISLFMIATVLIIYYKQITEGFDDHDRFRIMRNVGLSDQEIQSTINKQVLMVFFLPLGMAVVHIAVAFPVLCKLLLAFNMANRLLFLGCTAGTILLFGLVYYVVYHKTSKTYYRIVQAK